jgi:tRNA(fMet)-specific endonuclease VapC
MPALPISALTQGGIIFGIENKPKALRLRVAVEIFLIAVQIQPWDTSVAPVYEKLRAGLDRAGKFLSGLDMLIAGHALALGATLVTHDRGFRPAAAFLRVVYWATDLCGIH